MSQTCNQLMVYRYGESRWAVMGYFSGVQTYCCICTPFEVPCPLKIRLNNKEVAE
jgi:hypothetical protein